MAYRILSLDGGGIRGTLTIRLIERLSEKFPAFLESVDLIAGTSTGGNPGALSGGGPDAQACTRDVSGFGQKSF